MAEASTISKKRFWQCCKCQFFPNFCVNEVVEGVTIEDANWDYDVNGPKEGREDICSGGEDPATGVANNCIEPPHKRCRDCPAIRELFELGQVPGKINVIAPGRPEQWGEGQDGGEGSSRGN